MATFWACLFRVCVSFACGFIIYYCGFIIFIYLFFVFIIAFSLGLGSYLFQMAGVDSWHISSRVFTVCLLDVILPKQLIYIMYYLYYLFIFKSSLITRIITYQLSHHHV